MKKPVYNLKSDKVKMKDNISEKKWRMMMKKIEHRKRRKKKKRGVREEPTGKNDDEPDTKKRKKKEDSLTKTMLLVGFLASVSICSGITKPQGMRKETAVKGSNQSDDLFNGSLELKPGKEWYSRPFYMTRNFNPTCNYEYGKIAVDDGDIENFNGVGNHHKRLGFLFQLLDPLDKEMDDLSDAVMDSRIEEV